MATGSRSHSDVSADPFRDRLAVINGLRGVAILAVVGHHMFHRHLPDGLPGVVVFGLPVSVDALIQAGWLGVDLFFVLSGFVLFLPYCRGTRTLGGLADARAFWRRRFLRLMPLHWLCLAVALVFVLRGDPATIAFWTDALLLATGAFTFTERLFFPLQNFVLWSLGVEIVFSLVFPGLVWLERRLGMGKLLLATLALSLAVRVLGDDPRYAAGPLEVLNPGKDNLFGRLDQFVAGMALAAVWVRRGPLGPAAARAACTAGVLLVLLVAFAWAGIRSELLPRAVVPFTNDVLIAGMAALGYGLLSVDRGLWHRVFTLGPLQVAGMMCYSLYLWHTMVLRKVPFVANDQVSPPHLVAAVLLMLVLSALTYRYVEFRNVDDARTLFRGARSTRPNEGGD